MGLSGLEHSLIERARAAPMLGWVEAWVKVNSGTRNLT